METVTEFILGGFKITIASLVAQRLMHLPPMRGTFPRLGRSLEKEMATHSGTLAWRILWTEEPGGLQPMELQRVGYNGVTDTFTFTLSLIKQSVPLD